MAVAKVVAAIVVVVSVAVVVVAVFGAQVRLGII